MTARTARCDYRAFTGAHIGYAPAGAFSQDRPKFIKWPFAAFAGRIHNVRQPAPKR